MTIDLLPDDGAEYRYFDTFESREAAFSAAVADLIPVRHQGPRVFWDHFRRISTVAPGPLPAYITSNPRDGLAFASPHQELAAAALTARLDPARIEDDIAALAERYDLTAALFQPMRTLSGGETVRLALAKALLAARHRPRLVIASPFTWLSANHRPLLHQTVAVYEADARPVHILAMRGEEDHTPMAPAWLAAAPAEPLAFPLFTRGMRIALGLPVNALTAEPAEALVHDRTIELVSPCLMAGANGQGKSLLAKALSGAVAIQGRFGIGRDGTRARLLFQDVITQTLLRDPTGLALPATGDKVPKTDARTILMDCFGILQRRGRPVPAPAIADKADLLGVKAALAAMRLAARPAALILDEPDWGLTRDAAIALVLAIVRGAHAAGVPVLIISHKPWWQPLARSCLKVTRTPCQTARFAITLEKATP